MNHAAETAFVRRTLPTLAGAENLLEFRPTMGAEDFSFFLLEKPGCYFLIGNGDGDHRDLHHGGGPCMLHNPSYDFNDALIPLGATAWVRLAEAWLARTARRRVLKPAVPRRMGRRRTSRASRFNRASIASSAPATACPIRR